MKYPKLFFLLSTCFLAYELHTQGFFDWAGHLFNGQGYISIFLAGLFFSFSFTTAFATALFIDMAPEVHPLIAAPIGGIGALIADLTIFSLVRFSFDDELHHLFSRPFAQRIWMLFHHQNLTERMKAYLLWSIAGLIIASPLPDELGVFLLGHAATVERRWFAPFCFLVNTAGILVILWGARVIGG